MQLVTVYNNSGVKFGVMSFKSAELYCFIYGGYF